MPGERGIMCRFDPENPWGFIFSASRELKPEPLRDLTQPMRAGIRPTLQYGTEEFSITLVRRGRVNREGRDYSL